MDNIVGSYHPRWALVDPDDEAKRAVSTGWESLANLLWKFDAHIQDELTAQSVTEAGAYQLGRGLAEVYWALDPRKVDGSTGWECLLGNDRCNELSRLVGRLETYLPEYTASAVAGSIEVWRKVAPNPAWRGTIGQASKELYLQIRRWYELVIVGQDPTTLVKPGQVMRNFRTIGRARKTRNQRRPEGDQRSEGYSPDAQLRHLETLPVRTTVRTKTLQKLGIDGS